MGTKLLPCLIMIYGIYSLSVIFEVFNADISSTHHKDNRRGSRVEKGQRSP